MILYCIDFKNYDKLNFYKNFSGSVDVNLLGTIKNLKYIKKNGKDVVFKIIRIPYYVQLSKDVAKFLFKDLIVHFSKELKNLPSEGFYSDEKYQMAISKVYKNMFTCKPAKSENEVLACGLHGVVTFPSEFTEKGIEKMLKDFSFARDENIKINFNFFVLFL